MADFHEPRYDLRVSVPVACSNCGALNGADFKSCIRCASPLDPNAAVAFGRARVPVTRTRSRMGAGDERLLGQWRAESLPVAKALLAITLAVYGMQFLLAYRQEPSLATIFSGGGVIDALRAGAMLSDPRLVAMEPWRLLSACFVHFGLLHIGMNMLGLINLCRLLEPSIGSVRLLILYVLSGIISFAGSLAYYTFTHHPSPTAGASGAIFGLMGAVLGFMFRRKDERWKTWLGQTIAYSVLFGFALGGVNNAAHISGLLSGVLCGWLVGDGAPLPSTLWQRLVAGACAVAVLTSLVLARISDLPELLLGLG